MALLTRPATGRGATRSARFAMLGPAFVAAVAYVDPGNVATNTSAGAGYQYLLLWVLVGATLMAGLIQYLSAKVGWLTGESLPALVGARSRRRSTRLAYWVQAELVAMATDIAEIVGGALALYLLFGLPLPLGALLTTVVSTALLYVQRRGQSSFERVITGLLAVVTVGFLAGLVVAPPDPAGAAAGLVPRLAGTDSALLAVGMLGATVMPHAVYLHSALVRDRHGRAEPGDARRVLGVIKADVVLAMLLAGSVNIGMLLLAAGALFGLDLDGLPAVHEALGANLGSGIAICFALALLASGLASTTVGGYAGAVVMDGLLRRRLPLIVRRLASTVPALVLLAVGADPTQLLILSQVVLSFGIPFALIPLVRIARDRRLMALAPTHPATIAVAWVVAAAIVALNVVLLVLLVLG